MADQSISEMGSEITAIGATERPRLAIVGSGVTGLSAAWALQSSHDVTVFEASSRIGGHTNTVTVDAPEGPVPVDTGFIVFNEPNYPNLTALFETLGVKSNKTRMDFSVSARHRDMEYASHGFTGLFADLRNLVRPRFFSMLADIMRFYKKAPGLANDTSGQSIGDYLKKNGYGQSFIDDHLLPMAAAIWSCPVGTILDFPAQSLAKFFVNHGLVELGTPFEWASVDGGSASYIAPLTAGFKDKIKLDTEIITVDRSADGVRLTDQSGTTHMFDKVILACHGPQAAQIVTNQDAQEREILSAFRTQPNRAVLHTDIDHMPRRRRAWSAWNYSSTPGEHQHLAVTYWMNKLQKLGTKQNYFVTLNPATSPSEETIVAEFDYHHPVFDARATKAQEDIWAIQGRGNVWYAGAWLGYGFHEDGLQAGLAIAEDLSDWRRPWEFDYSRERLIRPDRAHGSEALAA